MNNNEEKVISNNNLSTITIPWKAVINRQAAILLIVIVFTNIILLLSANGKLDSLLLIAFLSGSICGIVNNHFRLQDKINNNDVVNIDKYVFVKFQIYMSPVIGGLLALVLVLIFVGGLLDGAFFPTYNDATYKNVQEFLFKATPVNYSDVGKLLFWSFVAGFSEKFVPNYIDKLTNEIKDK